jgi:hypothetical protein
MKKILTLTLIAVFALTLSACGEKKSSVERKNTVKQNQTQAKLARKVGFPQVDDSLELRNLKNRYELLDDRNKTGYVYLISHGLIFAQYAVKGKVSSMESQFTNPVKLDCDMSRTLDPCGTIDQAEPDGSYGKNPDGVFFWTTDKVYVEWRGDYLYSDNRLEIQQPTQNIIAKPVK